MSQRSVSSFLEKGQRTLRNIKPAVLYQTVQKPPSSPPSRHPPLFGISLTSITGLAIHTPNMLTQTLLAAFAALVPLVASSAVPFDFHLARRTQYIDDLVSEDAILDAFIEANHPSAVPNRTWEDDNGETYQTLWTFDEADWQEMRASMLEKAGVVESDLVTHSTALTTRQDDPPAFFCKNINTNPTVCPPYMILCIYPTETDD